MMDKKKLSTIRAELRAAFAKSRPNPHEWFDRQLRKLERQPEVDQREIETLLLLRDALAEKSKRSSKRSGGQVRTR